MSTCANVAVEKQVNAISKGVKYAVAVAQLHEIMHTQQKRVYYVRAVKPTQRACATHLGFFLRSFK